MPGQPPLDAASAPRQSFGFRVKPQNTKVVVIAAGVFSETSDYIEGKNGRPSFSFWFWFSLKNAEGVG